MNDRPNITVVMVIALIMLAEYVLITWTQNYGADPDVVSHIGFAGTIVSIILALVAIFYSYYQGFAQQRDAQALGQQLSALRDLGHTLTESGESLANTGSELQQVRTQIQDMLEISRRTEKSSAETLAHIKQVQTAPPSPVAAPSAPAALNVEYLADRLVNAATGKQQALYEALCYAADHSLSTRKYADLVAAAVRTRYKKQGQEDIAETMGEWADGIATGYGELLEDLGLVSRIRSGDQSAIIRVAPEFRKAVKAASGRVLQPFEDLMLDVPSIRSEFAARDAQ